MFTLCIRGLTISVFETVVVRTLLLNSGYDPGLELPHHLPMLVLPRKVVKTFGVAPLPSLRGRVSLRELDALALDALDRDYIAWDLSGMTVTTGAAGAPTQIGGALPLTHPDPQAPDWSDLHWVMDLNRFQPEARLAPAALTPGALTSSVVELSGGTMAGGVPTNGEDSNWVWFFSPGITQAVTDTLTWTVSGPTTFSCVDDHGIRGTIVVDGDEVGFLVNEATTADNRREVDLGKSLGFDGKTPMARHAKGYIPALQLVDGSRPFTPVALYSFMGRNATENVLCVPLRV